MQREHVVQPRAIDLWGHTMTTIRPCHIDGEFPKVHPVHLVMAVDQVVGFAEQQIHFWASLAQWWNRDVHGAPHHCRIEQHAKHVQMNRHVQPKPPSHARTHHLIRSKFFHLFPSALQKLRGSIVHFFGKHIVPDVLDVSCFAAWALAFMIKSCD